MKKITRSGFQFVNPIIKRLLFQVNEEFDKGKYEGLDISYAVNVFEKEESSAVVELRVKVGEKGNTTPYFVDVIIASKFRWTDDIEGNIDNLLKKNAATALMSYARPVIAHSTADAGFRPFNLPFVDFSNDFSEEQE